MLFTLLHVYIFISRFICRFQETLKNCLIRAVIFCIPSDPSTFFISFFISLNSILIRSRERTIYKPFSWSFPSFSHGSSLVYFFSSSPQQGGSPRTDSDGEGDYAKEKHSYTDVSSGVRRQDQNTSGGSLHICTRR